MNDMRAVIVPKSDQTNADDLLGGPITITVTGVVIRSGTEQPVAISFEGDNGKPYRPCKSMCRVMVHCWGADANNYVGRSMTLYCDPKVQWGGMAVGGIRISHLSHIDGPHTMALTATKGRKNAFTVAPLVVERKPSATGEKKQSVAEWLDDLEASLKAAETDEDIAAIVDGEQVQKAKQRLRNGSLERLTAILAAAQPAPPATEDDDFPGRVENAPEHEAA